MYYLYSYIHMKSTEDTMEAQKQQYKVKNIAKLVTARYFS